MLFKLFFVCLRLIYASLKKTIKHISSCRIKILDYLRILSAINLAVSVIEVLKVFLREFQLHLPLFILLIMLIVTVLVWSFIHLHKFQENAIFL